MIHCRVLGKRTEAKARILGVLAQMSTFPYLYGTMLAKMILKHADNLSTTLQYKSMSAAEGQQVAGCDCFNFGISPE